MSQTISVGVVGPSYWTYMATVMAECLDAVTKSNRIETGQVPGGVFHDARTFSELALEATGSSMPENPPASLNAYGIAAEVIRRSFGEVLKNRKEVDQRLAAYADFIRRLDEPRTLHQREHQTAENLQTFFLDLKEQGEAEAYESSIAFGTVPVGLRNSA
jgi:hypothetical protein